MDYLLDTNIISFYFRGDKNVETKMLSVGVENLFISSVSYFELVAGYSNSSSSFKQKSLKLLAEFVELIEIIDLDSESAKIAGQEKALLVKNGNIIEDTDLLIAGTAMAHTLTLVTNNTKYFTRLSYLELQDWSQSSL